eukprot:5440029-Prymnesium_polylepis.2
MGCCSSKTESPAEPGDVRIEIKDPTPSAAQYHEKLQPVVEVQDRSRSESMLQMLSTALAGASAS